MQPGPVIHAFLLIRQQAIKKRSRIHSALPEPDVSVKFTDTHVIVLRCSYGGPGDPIQIAAHAFTIPDDQWTVRLYGILSLAP